MDALSICQHLCQMGVVESCVGPSASSLTFSHVCGPVVAGASCLCSREPQQRGLPLYAATSHHARCSLTPISPDATATLLSITPFNICIRLCSLSVNVNPIQGLTFSEHPEVTRRC